MMQGEQGQHATVSRLGIQWRGGKIPAPQYEVALTDLQPGF